MKKELDLFLDYCHVECNLKEITISSYKMDIEGFFSYLLSVRVDDAKNVRESEVPYKLPLNFRVQVDNLELKMVNIHTF